MKIVTCALPYANGELHIGHIASTYLPADIFVRFLRAKGEKVIFACATDDFGTPILIKAEEEKKTPEDYVAYWHKRDEEDFTKLGIIYDIFYKTSSKENIELARHFFDVLHKNGFIYKRVIQQQYCNRCKRFLPDRYIKGICPYCNAKNQYSDSCESCGRVIPAGEIREPRCAVCGAEPITKTSEHYFFKLSAFSNDLRAWLENNKNIQDDVKKYVLGWIDEGLKDWDITRDISWGVPIDNGKVLYGWFDNHLCYISTVLKYCSDNGLNGREIWNSSIIYHFIGKDIIYHHYLFLPAMRLGVKEFKLPDFIPVRGHLLYEGKKISKSRGWYIGVRDFLNKFPPDYLRYYLSIITQYSQGDANFDWKSFKERINDELVANMGNFVYRALSFIWTKSDKRVPEPENYDELDKHFEKEIISIANNVAKDIEKLELDKGLRKIMEFSSLCNQYFQQKRPWHEDPKTCLYLSANAVRVLAVIIEPYLPFSSERLFRQLNLSKQGWITANKLLVKPNHEINKPEPLFEKV